jgi:thiamine kinase-like enzyme
LAGKRASISLPDANLDVYHSKLRAARQKIQASLRQNSFDPGFSADDLATLHHVLSWFDAVESQWDRWHHLVHNGPCTVVHGDFAPKNVLIRNAAGTWEALPVDWDVVGWGHPAVDLGESPDLSAYSEEAMRLGASWSLETVTEWAELGKILRHIAAFEWSSTDLVGGRAPRAIWRMQARLGDTAIPAPVGI